MQLISKYNRGIRYLLCAIDLFNKYAFVVRLKEIKGTTLLMRFKVFWTIQKENQIRYGLIMVVNFTTLILKIWFKDNNRNVFNTRGRRVCCC